VRADATSPVNATVVRTAGTVGFFEDLLRNARDREFRPELDRTVAFWTPGVGTGMFEFELRTWLGEEKGGE
jgi:hypothetical protein